MYKIIIILLCFAGNLQAQNLKDVYRDFFPMGVAIKPEMVDDRAEVALILQHFNSLTAENAMKPGPIHPEENRYDWAPSDKIVDFAVRNGLKMRGHTLCWHNQLPAWFLKDAAGNRVSRAVLLARMERHIQDVVGRYKGKIYAWDVVNEAISDEADEVYRNAEFYQILGEEFIEKAFEFAHKADPQAQLFYNDYDTENPVKRERIVQLVKKLLQKGVPIHGVGLQGHWSLYEPGASALEESIRQFAQLGLKVQITELDVSVHVKEHKRRESRPTDKSEFTREMNLRQAAHYKMIFEVLRKYKSDLTGVTFWNLSDKKSWLDNFPVRGRKDYPLLFDQNFQPKKAFYAVTDFKLPANTIQIDTEAGTDTISRHIYGHFAEHLGRCIYDGFYVGEQSAIPNVNGVRKDVVEALKKLKIPNLRWPGGCFADTYHWKDGIGPKDKRPSMLNVWWGNTTEDNSFGTHEFLNMCELLGTEPYLSANVGSGSAQEMSDWIKYTTHPNGSSPMTNERLQNGRTTPWKVKFWGLGNEAWGCGGNMTAEYYANVYRQFATFTTNWSNSDRLCRIASGASDADYHWTETLMKNIPKNLIDAVALHHYSVIDWNNKGSATAFDESTYFKTMKQALLMNELVRRHSEVMDQYDPLNKIALFVDEWGGWYDVEPGTNGAFLYQQNTMRDAVLAGATLNIFNNHCKRVKMANLAQTVNVLQAVILTDKAKMLLTPTYHVMEMYAVHHDALMLPIEITCDDYVSGDERLPAVSATASVDKTGKMHISLTNIDTRNAKTMRVELKGARAFKSLSGRLLTSAKIQDCNTFDQPTRVAPVAFTGAKLSGNSLEVTLPPGSVVVLSVE